MIPTRAVRKAVWERRNEIALHSFLVIAMILKGAGNAGVDDASLEVVDPAKVPLTPKSVVALPKPEKLARELAEVLSKMPDRPQNLDFDR